MSRLRFYLTMAGIWLGLVVFVVAVLAGMAYLFLPRAWLPIN